jgi:AraC family transcriptional activator of tynA and feaB
MSAHITAQRWSTLHSPPAAQFAHWRELICEAFLDLTPESERRDGFLGEVTQIPLGGNAIARIRSQAQQVRRTPRDIARAPMSGYYANLQVSGESVMTQGGRSTVLRPGDLAIVDTTEPFEFGFAEDFMQLSFYIPGEVLRAQLDKAVPTATRVDTTTGVGAAARHALVALADHHLSAATAVRLAALTSGLLAAAVEQPAEPVSRSARGRAAALADLAEHLGDADLSPASTARRLGISVRQLHALFAEHDRSFSAEVRRRRLEVARRDLTDAARAHLRVIDISVEAGFVNVASFHRAFRRQFGQTPAQVRAAALGPQ